MYHKYCSKLLTDSPGTFVVTHDCPVQYLLDQHVQVSMIVFPSYSHGTTASSDSHECPVPVNMLHKHFQVALMIDSHA